MSTRAGEISLCWKKRLLAGNNNALPEVPHQQTQAMPWRWCWCKGWPSCGAKKQAELGQLQDRCPFTALPSCSACLQGGWRGWWVGVEDSGPQAHTAFDCPPRVSMTGPESTTECWFIVWPPPGSWTDHWSHPKSNKDLHTGADLKTKNILYYSQLLLLIQTRSKLPIPPCTQPDTGSRWRTARQRGAARATMPCSSASPRKARGCSISCCLMVQNTYMPQGQISVKLQ